MAENQGMIADSWPADVAEVYREIAEDDRHLAAAMAGAKRQAMHMTPVDHESRLAKLHADLGLKRLSPVWAKLEIVLGLLATGAAIPLMTINRDATSTAAGLALFILGGYLAMAGHRSHLYQSNNLLAAYLADEIRKHHPRV